MAKQIQQKVALELHRQNAQQWTLRYGKVKQDGAIGWEQAKWTIGKDSRGKWRASWLPLGLFHPIRNRVFHHIKGIPKRERSFDTLQEQIRAALCKTALNCGCRWKTNDYGGVTWNLNGKKFLAFTIINFEKHNRKKPSQLAVQLRQRRPVFVKMEKKCGALLRVAVVVVKGKQGSEWCMVPAKTRAEVRS